ncbi:MAG TPA: ergothioneine biosynthesis protein EgtC [Acidimicrobiales bacterium]|nr:ergothioneine biosynthesis protein EgtC [Acidimicrobiales bacterium]
MCRFVAYLGPPVTLQALLYDPPHSLVRQSWAPRHQRQGAVNADGFGVGWYDHEVRAEPARWRTPRPAWADRSFASVAGLVRSTAVLAALRDATPPSPVEESGTPPFTSGPWLFAHNGRVEGFAGGGPTKVGLRRRVSDTRAAGIEGASDSEVLFALALDRLDEGAEPGRALADVVATASGVAPARLNLVLTDGHRLGATAWGESLFVRESEGTVVVASEPYDDDPRWTPVPDRSLVVADRSGAGVAPLTP